MNRKGFTLIELLAVIAILALLTILVYPSITGSIKNNSEKTDDVTLKLIYNASELYIANHASLFPKYNGNKYVISLNSLVDDGLLVSPISLSNSNRDLTNSMSVQVTYNDGFNYELRNNASCQYILYGYKFIDSDESESMNLGDIFSYEDEEFYVISSDDISIKLLTKLGISNDTVPVQTESPLNIIFAARNYWSSYPEYVYDNNSIIYNFAEKYKQHLIDEGLKADDIRLISLDELKNSGCALSGLSGDCSSAPEFITSMNYWTGTSSSASEIFVVSGRNITSTSRTNNLAIRPIIVINK